MAQWQVYEVSEGAADVAREVVVLADKPTAAEVKRALRLSSGRVAVKGGEATLSEDGTVYFRLVRVG